MFNLPTISAVDILSSIGILIILFLALREFITWYWKLNKISDTLLRIETILEEIENKIAKDKKE